MIQFDMESMKRDGIPFRVLYPLRQSRKQCAVFYHGWSSSGAQQITRAVILAAHGYTVLLPDAIHHGERGILSDYYEVPAYDVFWETLFQNVEEFPTWRAWLSEQGFDRPWVLGHSMGGMTAMGVAARYPGQIRGAVSFNGSGDWMLTHLFMQARFGVLKPRDWLLEEAIEERSPLRYINAMREVPLFMTNGEADGSVDPRAQAHFAEELAKAGGRGVRVTYPGLAHFVTTNMLDDALSWMEGQEDQQRNP